MIKSNRVPHLIFGVSLLLTVLLFFVFGATVGGDKPRYLDLGAQAVAWMLGEGLQDRELTSWDIFFFLPNVVIHFGHTLFGQWFQHISIAINVLLFCWLAATTSRRVLGVTSTQLENGYLTAVATVLLVVALFIGLPAEVVKYTFNSYSPDITAMVIYALVLLNCIQHYFATHGVRSETHTHRTKKYLWFACVLALMSAFTRPAGIVPVAIVFIVLIWEMNFFSSLASRIVGFVVAPSVIAFVLWPYWAFHMNAHHFNEVSFGMQLMLFNYADGSVVSERPETYIQNVDSALDFMWITVLRTAYYLVPLRSAFSTPHFIANLAYLVFLLYFMMIGWKYLKTVGEIGAKVLWLVLLQGYYFALLHAMTQVDDFRYELPLWPSVWIIGTFGVVAWSKSAFKSRTA